MKYIYRVIFTQETDGGYLVTFPDIPEAITQGDDLEQARTNALDALDEAVAAYMLAGKALPTPSKHSKSHTIIAVPVQTVLKHELRRAMQAHNVNNTELAKKLGVQEKEVRRVIDPHHNTSLARLEAALLAMGKQPVVSLVAA